MHHKLLAYRNIGGAYDQGYTNSSTTNFVAILNTIISYG